MIKMILESVDILIAACSIVFYIGYKLAVFERKDASLSKRADILEIRLNKARKESEYNEKMLQACITNIEVMKKEIEIISDGR